MSMDVLQEKIRKRKCPIVLELGFSTNSIPDHIEKEAPSQADALGTYCRQLLAGLKGYLPAVRFHFGAFAIHGAEGIAQLQLCLKTARDLQYYVLLDAPELLSPAAAQRMSEALLGRDSDFCCDGLIIGGYLGTDVIKPFLSVCKQEKKTVFIVARTGNKSASELQDLLTGSRLVHMVAADYVNRGNSDSAGKYGYGCAGIVGAAGAGDSLKALRAKYPGLFLLVDGYDYASGNGKKCANAFDKYGHGALICAGSSISGAWIREESDGADYLIHAQNAVERIRKNLGRYITVL